MADTLITNKKRFIQYLEKNIKDDEIIVLTIGPGGNMSVNKKKNAKKVEVVFAADAFARPDTIGHLMLGQTPLVAFCICPPEFVAKKTLEQVKDAESTF